MITPLFFLTFSSLTLGAHIIFTRAGYITFGEGL
jgi:hypothetical protein